MTVNWYKLGLLALESQQVILLRTMRLAGGGSKARREANRLITEKLVASTHATTRLMLGDPPDKIIDGYRKTVRRNARRLSK